MPKPNEKRTGRIPNKSPNPSNVPKKKEEFETFGQPYPEEVKEFEKDKDKELEDLFDSTGFPYQVHTL